MTVAHVMITSLVFYLTSSVDHRKIDENFLVEQSVEMCKHFKKSTPEPPPKAEITEEAAFSLDIFH